MDILSYIWTVLSFLLSVIWTLVWFVLRDLISTMLWLLIVAWMLLSVRYRSFTGGTLALLRYGRWAANLFWRWLRGTPNPALPPPPPKVITKEVIKVVGRRRKRFGTMNVSEQLNVLLLGAIWLLFVI